jgi:hypothetical protein
MADQSDVANALLALAASAVYPGGLAAPSVAGVPVRLYRGWPDPETLAADLRNGAAQISIFPEPEGEVNTTRYLPAAHRIPRLTPPLVASVSGTTATFSGSVAAGVLAGLLVDGASFVYVAQANDTPALVAAALALQVMAVRPAYAQGASVTVPGALHLIARTAAPYPMTQELKRQRQKFRLTGWCPSPELRDALMPALDQALAATPFLALADGSAARLRFVASRSSDQDEMAFLYRRDLIYSAEYPTLAATSLPGMLFADVTLGSATSVGVTLTL